MTRSTIIAAATLVILSGCGGTNASPVANEAVASDNIAVEDVPSDSLAAPGDAPLDRESDGGNDAGNEGGDNAR